MLFPTEMNLVDILYQMLRDQDPQVVCNCVSALDEILANEGGMVITKKIAHYLINKYAQIITYGGTAQINKSLTHNHHSTQCHWHCTLEWGWLD